MQRRLERAAWGLILCMTAGCSGGSPGTTVASTDGESTETDASTGSSDSVGATSAGSTSPTAGGSGSETGASADPTTEGPATTGSTTTTATTGAPATTDASATDSAGTSDGSGTTDEPGTTTGAIECPGGGLGPGDHELELEFDGLTRSFLLHVPPSYDGSEPTPLVLNFHGLSSNAAQQELFSGMTPHADAEGYIVAYPQGYQSSWNGGACCGGAVSQDLDDVGLARAIVEDIEAALCVDHQRIYATGMSNGGFMSNRLACEAADLFAAVAPVSSVIGVLDCEPARPISIMMFNGTADVLVPYNGGGFFSAPETFAGWADRNGCVGDPVQTFAGGAASCLTYDDCDEGVEVTLCTIDPMGHCWPGQAFCPFPPANTDIVANDEMWAIFQQFPLP